MVQRELYHTRFIACMLLFVDLVWSCNSMHETKIEIPGVYADVNKERVEIKDGMTTAKGKIFSGIAYALYPGGDTALKIYYYNGKQVGMAEQWYRNRQIAETRYYHEGRKTGIHRGWYADGKPKFVYHMKDDRFEGNVKEWYADGKLYLDFNYVNGQEEGMERMYWTNGKIRANYQSVNGRKYGLTGVKNCVSVWSDSVSRH